MRAGVLPDLATAETMADFPTCTVDQLRSLEAKVYQQQAESTVLVGGGTEWLHLDVLLQCTDPTCIVGKLTEGEMEDVVRSCYGSGRLPELRAPF